MTYKEKLMKEHPDHVHEDGWCEGCPNTYGYNDGEKEGFCSNVNCRDCWDREMPETEEANSLVVEKEKVYLTLSKAFFKHKSSCESELSIAIEKALVYLAETLE